MSTRGIVIILGLVVLVAGAIALAIWPAGEKPVPPSDSESIAAEEASRNPVNQSTRVVLVMDTDGLSSDAEVAYLDSTVSILQARCSEQFPDRPPTITTSGGDTIVFEISGVLDCGLADNLLARQGRLELRLAGYEDQCDAVIAGIDSAIVANSSVGDRDPRPFSSVLRSQNVPCQWYVWDDNKQRINGVLQRDEINPVIPDDLEFLWDARPHFAGDREYNILHLVEREVVVEGSDVVNASLDLTSQGSPAVAFELSPDGAKRLSQVTASNVGRLLAIIVDTGIESTPVIRAEIGAHGIIALRSDATRQDADILALLLRHPPYPRRLSMIECLIVRANNES